MDDLEQRLHSPGPKRLLALDGGGVRGALTVEYLAELERLLGERSPDPQAFRLADYYDLIAGTSTGAIIAACLARGYAVATVRELYEQLADDIFTPSAWRRGLLSPRYRSRRLRAHLEDHLGGLRMGSPELRTGLVVVTKRLDTSSTWPITNLPRGRYFTATPGSNATPNADYSLVQVVRASTAAPGYFRPERLQIAEGVEGTFVDGGVSTANNPALLLFLVATLRGFSLSWPTGADQLLLTSVGTGSSPAAIDTTGLLMRPAALHAVRSVLSIMGDADALNQTLLQAWSQSPTARHIDSEIGDLSEDGLGSEPLLTYQRYTVELDSGWLARHLDYVADDASIARLRAMDNARGTALLADVGRHAAARQVRPEHFPATFDLPGRH